MGWAYFLLCHDLSKKAQELIGKCVLGHLRPRVLVRVNPSTTSHLFGTRQMFEVFLKLNKVIPCN